jgi:ribosome assembly protein 1
MIYPDLHETTIAPKNKLEEDLYTGRAEPDSYVAAYVSKMFAVSKKELPEKKKRPLAAEEMRVKAREARAARATVQRQNELTSQLASKEESPALEEGAKEGGEDEEVAEVILGFARLYSGVMRMGSTVLALLPKYNPTLDPTHPHNQKYIVSATVEGLYIMMGRDLVPVDFVRAGNIFAIKGLESKVYRSATLCGPSEKGVEGDIADFLGPKSWLVNLGAISRAVSENPFCISPVISERNCI